MMRLQSGKGGESSMIPGIGAVVQCAAVSTKTGYIDVATTTAASGAASHDVNMPSRVAGDLLIMRLSGSSAFTPPSFSGWTLFSPNASRTNHLYYRTATGSGDVFQDSGGPALFVVWSFRGTTGAPVLAAESSASTDTNPNPPNATSGFGSVPTMWLALYGTGGAVPRPDASATAYPTNYDIGQGTLAYNYTGSVYISAGWAFRLLTASSENPAVFTIASSAIWAAYTIAIKMA